MQCKAQLHGLLPSGCRSRPAIAAANDLLAQADHIESYFARWNSLQVLVHAVVCEVIIQGPLPEAVCERADELSVRTTGPCCHVCPRQRRSRSATVHYGWSFTW